MKSFKLALLAITTSLLLQGCNDDSDSYQPPSQPPDIKSEMTGLWTSNDTESDLLALAFFEDGSYIHVEVENKPEPLLRQAFTIQSGNVANDGMEWGKYTIDNKTGALKVNQIFDDNGENGLSENLTQYISVSEGILTIQIDENNNGVIDSNESFSFSKAKNDGYLGIWRGEETEDELESVAFFEDGTYIQLKVDAEKSLDNPENGMEWGNYTVDANTGRLETSQIFDDNGISGFSEPLTRYLKASSGELTLDVDENQNGVIDENESFDFSKNRPIVMPTSKKLIGLWENKDTSNDLLALAFFDDGTYVHMEVDERPPFDNPNNEKSGMEWGRFTLNDKTGELKVNQIFDNNGDTGLSDILIRYARISGDTLTLEVDENRNGAIDNDESFKFEKAKSEKIVGLWRNKDTNNELLALAFFDDGTYVHMEVDNAPPFDNMDNEISGMEWGNYTINGITGALTVNQILDNNGSTGLSDALSRYVRVNDKRLTLEVDENKNGIIDDDEFFHFQRQ